MGVADAKHLEGLTRDLGSGEKEHCQIAKSPFYLQQMEQADANMHFGFTTFSLNRSNFDRYQRLKKINMLDYFENRQLRSSVETGLEKQSLDQIVRSVNWISKTCKRA